MIKVYEGKISGATKKFGIIVSRFNSLITDKLLEGAIDALRRNDTGEECIEIIKVPGTFEIPTVLKRMAFSKKYDAVICLGTIIRGGTSHNEYIADNVIKLVSKISVESGIPVSLGILTVENIEQAIERAGTKYGNRGFEAAMVAMEMTNLFSNI